MSELKHGWVGCVCGKLAACEDSDNGALRCGPDCCFGEAMVLNVADLGRIQERLQAHYNERVSNLSDELERTKDHLAAIQRDRDALAARVRELEAKTAELAWGGSQ